jgi:hypothetical protein
MVGELVGVDTGNELGKTSQRQCHIIVKRDLREDLSRNRTERMIDLHLVCRPRHQSDDACIQPASPQCREGC